MKKLLFSLLILYGCAGTYYVTEVDHRTHHPNCDVCEYNKHHNHHWGWYNTYPTTK